MTNRDFNTNDPTSNGVENAIKKLDWDEPEKYRVEWKSADKWQYESPYAVKEFRFGEGGKAMMLLLGPGGGEYLIDSNPPGRPIVKKERSDGYVVKDRLAEIQIFSEEFNWRHRVLRMIEEASSRVADEV